MTKTELYLIRHGETDWNLRRALQGRLNTPLNANGLTQAQAARAKLIAAGIRLDAVFASPLQRAVTTASIVSGLTPARVITDERLIEIAFGEWEGREMAGLSDAFSPFFKAPELYEPPQGGEDYASLLRRTGDFLQTIATQYAGKRVLAASHGAASAALLTHARGLSVSDIWKTPVHNCQIFVLTAEDGAWSPSVSVL